MNVNEMTDTIPTHAQVRVYYKRQGYEVRISKEGHILLRKEGGKWLEGRWVSEHRVIDNEIVLT